ncbi:MAG: hypothetical protein EOP76_18515 [Variovorax sp.]|nr:MAG: hypothetical protein EOP76_18515 [Variovorax sp.]
MTASHDTSLKPREDAGTAVAEGGVVILNGPDGVAVTMTAAAAMQTADSLYSAAKAVQESQSGGDSPDLTRRV